MVPVVIEHVWDMNPGITTQGSYPFLHGEGYIGGIAKGLFGYNGNPSLVEVTVFHNRFCSHRINPIYIIR